MSSYLLKTVPRSIRRALERELSNGAPTDWPELLKSLTSEQRVSIIIVKELLVAEIKAKNTRMVVRTIQLLAVLATVVIANLPGGEPLSDALHKFLIMLFDESARGVD